MSRIYGEIYGGISILQQIIFYFKRYICWRIIHLEVEICIKREKFKKKRTTFSMWKLKYQIIIEWLYRWHNVIQTRYILTKHKEMILYEIVTCTECDADNVTEEKYFSLGNTISSNRFLYTYLYMHILIYLTHVFLSC